VVGADGLIGSALVVQLRNCGFKVFETSRRSGPANVARSWLDLAGEVESWIPPGHCSAAVICAAISSYEKCRSSPQLSQRVNLDGTVKAAEKLARIGSRVVFLSTNAVFDGTVPYRRIDETVCPQTEYGKQKAEAEHRLLELGEKVSILRLTKVFAKMPALLTNWLGCMKKGQIIEPFHDLSAAPVSLDDVLSTLIALLKARQVTGIWHFSGDRDVSYADIAYHLAHSFGLDGNLVRPASVQSSNHYLEHVPKYTSLECSRVREHLGIKPPSVWPTIDSVVQL
jgi:dTDP-4-dehydrorhamnose reductase